MGDRDSLYGESLCISEPYDDCGVSYYSSFHKNNRYGTHKYEI